MIPDKKRKLGSFVRCAPGSARGSVLLEGVIGMVLIIGVLVGGLLLLINTYLVMVYQDKLRVVADATARYASGKQYWLGMKRPDYKEAEAHEQARQLANSLLHEIGLPSASSVEILQTKFQAPGVEGMTDKVNVRIMVNGIRTIGNAFIPFLNITGTGTAFENALPPYCVAQTYSLNENDPNNVKRIQYPAYGADVISAAGVTTPTARKNHSPYGHFGEFAMPFTYVGTATIRHRQVDYPADLNGPAIVRVDENGSYSRYSW
jgi:hypothetical protein